MMRTIRTMLGVTLLEIMLVLAIAGVVIAMSIRYYQSASTNQKVTAGMSAVSAVSAAVEQSILSGNYLKASTVIALATYFPDGKVPASPWNGVALTATGKSTSTYDIVIETTDKLACTLLEGQINAQGGFKAVCGSDLKVTVTVGQTGAAPPS